MHVSILLQGPNDYQGGEKLAIFEIGSSTATVVYTTVSDGIREGLERFFADLTVPPDMMAMGIFPGTPSRATVNIIDNEGLHYIQWLHAQWCIDP